MHDCTNAPLSAVKKNKGKFFFRALRGDSAASQPRIRLTNPFCTAMPMIFSLLSSTHTIFSLLDLRKTFDSVLHQPLIDILASSNLPSPLLNWLHSYLLNRAQHVVVNDSSSSSLPVSSGVRQGSIIGPLLFLIYINGLTKLSFSPLTHIILKNEKHLKNEQKKGCCCKKEQIREE